MTDGHSFTFYTERRLIALTGFRAKTLMELLGGLQQVPGASIFYHTHQRYLAHHFVKPLFYNDFALWAAEALQEDRLAEKLAAIDLLQFTTIRALREEIIKTIDAFLVETRGRMREAPPGEEFHFSKSMSFVFSTGVVAHDRHEFFEKLPQVTNASLYYHFFEARLRLGRTTNDFSAWLDCRGETDLARAIDKLDPYIRTLDELKQDILELVRRYNWREG